MRELVDTSVTDAIQRASEVPWVLQSEGVWFRPLRISPEAGTWVNILRVERAGTISRHRHLGAVQAYVLSGSWRYLEHDWIAHAGDYVFEGAGDVHTLVVEGDEPMETLFVIDGPYEYVNDEGEVTGVESAASKLSLYLEHCERAGVAVAPIVY